MLLYVAGFVTGIVGTLLAVVVAELYLMTHEYGSPWERLRR